MASRQRGRGTLSQALDREVYQVVRRLVDSHEQYATDSSARIRLNLAMIYDEIRRSNSSLNRKPKKLLEDSIERVLSTIEQDAAADSESETANGEGTPMDNSAVPELQPQPASSGLNRSIVGQWSTNVPRSASTPKRDQDSDKKSERELLQTNKRKAHGEPLPKRRKATASAIYRAPPTHVSLMDLGGIEDVVQQLEDLLVLPMTRPEVFSSTGLQPSRGILIHGPPGCGKTMIANAFAAELGVDFISISAPSVVSGMSGESEKALRDHFDEAKKCAPCLMFIDEIDAITPKREGAQREMEKRIVAQLLICMDDLSLEKTDGKPVIVLAATNRPESLDPALRRGGRFDREINMSVPGEPVREQILRALTRKQAVAPDVDFALLARRTPGFVGADLSDLVSTAGLGAVKRYQAQLKQEAENDESVSMEVDGTNTDRFSVSASKSSPAISSLRRLIKYNKEHPFVLPSPVPDLNGATDTTTPPPALVSPFQITSLDFLSALPKIQPSALREGFATIPSTTFADIGSLSQHIVELHDTIINPILNPSHYTSLGIAPSSGTLLWGPPGNGKTLLAKAVANASHANFISVKGPELLNKYVGESERTVRQLFTRARSSVPVIIFFDELDALLPRRDGAMSEASTRVVNTVLTELDGVGGSRDGIYVIAATNRPDMVDPAMLRPGRLETLLYVGLPDAAGRVDVLRALCRNLNNFAFSPAVAAIAAAADGFSGADMQALVRRAALAAIRRAGTGGTHEDMAVTLADFEHARAEVRRSVSVAEMKRFDGLQREWGKTAG